MKNEADVFFKASELRPTEKLLDKETTITIVGSRCIYINDHRSWGGKPYVSESLPYTERKVTVRDLTDAFSLDELMSAIKERLEREAFYHGLRSYMNTLEKKISPMSNKVK